jgi:hypothetical protein
MRKEETITDVPKNTHASQLAGNHVNAHARRPHTRVNSEHTQSTLTNTHTHAHTHTSTTKVFGGMSSSSNGVDRRGFVVARASQYSLLSLLPVRATRTLSITGLAGSIEAANVCKSRTGRTSVHASTGRRAEKILRDGNRTITTQHGRDRSRWRLAGRHKTSFRLHQSGPAHKTHVVLQQKRTLLSSAGPRTAAADKVGI